MNDEVYVAKYRAETLDGNIVCGGLTVDNRSKTWIITAENFHYNVKPRSIKQFTGLSDSNGDEIYVGDVLQGKTYDGALISHGMVVRDIDLGRFYISEQLSDNGGISYGFLKSYVKDLRILSNKKSA